MSTGEWAGHRTGEPGFRRAAVAVFLAGVAVFSSLYAPQALLPELTRSFTVTPAASTLAISVSTAALAVGLLVLGPLSDRRGRTGILHASLAANDRRSPGLAGAAGAARTAGLRAGRAAGGGGGLPA
jgi:YNFM family putative membrane transporter